MPLESVVGYVLDMSEHVDMESDVSSYCSVVFGGFELTSPNLTSSSGSTLGQLMMYLNIVSALIVRTWHSWNAKIVAHFLSLALTAPDCLSSYF